MSIQLKRAYDKQSLHDGQRILVDKLWPRGISKQALHAKWQKELAPSNSLRKAFHEQDISWQTFRNRYLSELAAQREHIRKLCQQADKNTLTPLYASKDTQHNNAVVLKQYMQMLMR